MDNWPAAAVVASHLRTQGVNLPKKPDIAPSVMKIMTPHQHPQPNGHQKVLAGDE
jgi:hypothetical protein